MMADIYCLDNFVTVMIYAHKCGKFIYKSIFKNINLTIFLSFNFILIKFNVIFMGVLAFPRGSMSFVVHCHLVVYHSIDWLHRRHGVWISVVGIMPKGGTIRGILNVLI
jgi:hypothetical protein